VGQLKLGSLNVAPKRPTSAVMKNPTRAQQLFSYRGGGVGVGIGRIMRLYELHVSSAEDLNRIQIRQPDQDTANFYPSWIRISHKLKILIWIRHE